MVIKNLEKREWIRKEVDEQNRKRYKIYLTSKGASKLKSVPESLYKTDKTEFDPLACLNDPEKEELNRLLAKLRKQFES